MAQNYASVFSTKIDERFTRESQAAMALNNNYQFKGVKTVEVYSIPVVAMHDYTRDGVNRYGTPENLGTEVQSLTITKDRSWTFVIDRGDKIQSQMVLDAGKAVSRQMSEVVIPEFDTYVFNTLAKAASANGNTDATAATKTNAYSLFLNAQEALGNKNVPEKGRIAFCSYKFANLMKQDSAFMKYGNLSQEMILKGIMGECDGIKIVKVPKTRLPEGCDFILTHPIAATAPKQLSEYKIHEDAPGISGWLVEGRMIYDCFVLNNKADAVYYHGTAVAD
jgi:N4-gp56 family major capsid protein